MITTVVRRIVMCYIGYRIGVYAAGKISDKIEQIREIDRRKKASKFYNHGQQVIYTTFVEEV